MALVKPISFGTKGAVTSYYKIVGYQNDYVTKTGVVLLGAYFSRESREKNTDPFETLRIELRGEAYKANPTLSDLYEAVQEINTFADAEFEATPAPEKENFPDLMQPMRGVSEEYEAAKQEAEAETLAKLD